MNVHNSIRIQRPAQHVWSILAENFADATWIGSVVRSYEVTDAEKAPGAPIAGRICEFSEDPSGPGAREMIQEYDADNRTFRFTFEPLNSGALPVRSNTVTVRVDAVSDTESEVLWDSSPELKAHGYLLYPALKVGIRKQFDGLLTALKAHAEA